TQRLAFGVLDSKNTFVYGKTAVYIARTPTSKAEGPYPAPGDSLITKPAFRSHTAASETSPIAAIYEAEVPFEKSGAYAVLVVTKRGGKLVGAATQAKVKKANPIHGVGEKPAAGETESGEDDEAVMARRDRRGLEAQLLGRAAEQDGAPALGDALAPRHHVGGSRIRGGEDDAIAAT